MQPLPYARGLAAVLSLLCGIAGLNAAEAVDYSPAPDWLAPPPPSAPLMRESRSGTVIVLDDTQVDVEREVTFSRQVIRVVAPAGLAHVGELQFLYDPAYETLSLHHVRIQRGDTTLDRLDPARVQVLRREQSAEAGLFDGRLTALLVLDDVRVGDTVDIASSIRGRNPVFAGRYASSFALQSFSPVESHRVRLIAAPERGLRFMVRGDDREPPAPVTGAPGAPLEWIMEGRTLPALEPEFDAPAWFQQVAVLECTEYRDWAEVARWGRELFSNTAEPTPEFQQIVRELLPLPAEKAALEALHRVQEDVRYLSLSLGESSHRPHPPGEVLARRLGDCKDKSLLLASLLHALGRDAVPALVSSTDGPTLAGQLPSPLAFDHAIVQLEFDGRTYWLDPTLTHQAGSLDDHAVGDFRLALPLRSETTRLVSVELTRRARSRLSINETFTCPTVDDPATLSVRRKYSGRIADHMRAYLRDTPAETVGKDQVNHYARVYPTIESTAAPIWNDDRATNEIELLESYRLPGFWESDEDAGTVTASFIPVALHDIITQPEKSVRDTPFGWGHPYEVVNHIAVRLPDEWEVAPETREEDFDCFTLDTEARYVSRRLDLNYHYRSTADHVVQDKVAEFSARVGKLRDRLGYQLTHFGAGVAGSDATTTTAFALNLPVAMLLVFIAAGGAYGGWRLVVHRRTATVPPPLPGPERLNGLGGWLVLVCISLVVGIVMSSIGSSIVMPVALDLHRWKLVTEPGMPDYHALFAPLLMFEAAFHVLRIVASITGLVLFFQRKQVFPRFMIVLISCLVAFTVLDGVAAAMLPGQDAAANIEAGGEAFHMMVYAAIWIPYFCMSRRVRSTFVH